MKLKYAPTYFADASALVQLVLVEAEPRVSSELRRVLDAHGLFYTTLLCFAEALGVLKRYWLKRDSRKSNT